MSKFKIGDKVRTTDNKEIATVMGVLGPDEPFAGEARIMFGPGDFGIASDDQIELVEESSVTTVEKENSREVVAICRAIDEYIFYDGNIERGIIAKPGLAMTVLIQVLVSNGLLTLDQVKRALKNKE